MGKPKLARGLYWRGPTIWVRRDPLDGGRRSTKLHDPKAGALWLAERERLAASPGYAASTRATIGEWVSRTIAFKRGRKKAEGTLHMYTIKLGHAIRLFGLSSPLSVITPTSMDDYITKRTEEGAKNNTISRELTCIRQMLKLARRAGVFGLGLDEVMPVGFSAEYEPTTRRIKRMTSLRKLWAKLTVKERAWVSYALATGGDISDVERAEKDDFDRARWVVRMRGTKNKGRTASIPIPREFRKLFRVGHAHLPLSWPNVSKRLPEKAKLAGLGHLSPKDLRRSACSWLVEAGVTEDAVSRWMRHRDTTMVRRIYGKMAPEKLGAILDESVQRRHKESRPLGEIGKRGGFKSRCDDSGGADQREIRGHELSQEGAIGPWFGTPQAHLGLTRIRAAVDAARQAMRVA